jgi:hypothetical protein
MKISKKYLLNFFFKFFFKKHFQNSMQTHDLIFNNKIITWLICFFLIILKTIEEERNRRSRSSVWLPKHKTQWRVYLTFPHPVEILKIPLYTCIDSLNFTLPLAPHPANSLSRFLKKKLLKNLCKGDSCTKRAQS